MRDITRLWKLIAGAALAGALAACGGGGGGGDGGAGTGTGTGGGGSSSGVFTLNATSVAFTIKSNGPVQSPTQNVVLHLADFSATRVAAFYRNGFTAPTWLTTGVNGSGLDYTFTFGASAGTLANGTYTTTVTIGTLDSSDRVLQAQDVPITLIVREGIVTQGPLFSQTVVSGSADQRTYTRAFNVIAPAGTQWTVANTQPWARGPAGTQQGGGTFNLEFDTAGLAVGQHSAQVVLRNAADASDTDTVHVAVTVTPAVLTVSSAPVVIGGATGLESGAIPVTFSLNTGTNEHPWTITTSTTSGGNWLRASAANGLVSSAGATFTLDAGGVQLAAGTYTGSVNLQVTVNGNVLQSTIPVTLNYESNRLLVSATGVAFSSFPARQVLTRTLRVFNTRDTTGVPWTATDDQPWLTVTSSGVTSDGLVLTADATGLAAGQYFANVTVASPEPSVANQETVRVGLTVGAVNPQATIDIATSAPFGIVTSPVEPLAFVLTHTSVLVYDINTGALLRTLTGSFTNAESLTISDDGRTIYVVNTAGTAFSVSALDSTTGAVVGSYTYSVGFSSQPPAIQYARPGAHPMLLDTVMSHAVDLVTGATSVHTMEGPSAAIRADQRLIYMQNAGVSSAWIKAYRATYTAFGSVGFRLVEVAFNNGVADSRGFGRDVALSPDEGELYAAAGLLDVLDGTTLVKQGSVTVPQFVNNVETCWSGLVAANGGRDVGGDIWVFDAAGAEIGRRDSGGSMETRMLRFSGDCARLVMGTNGGVRIQGAP